MGTGDGHRNTDGVTAEIGNGSGMGSGQDSRESMGWRITGGLAHMIGWRIRLEGDFSLEIGVRHPLSGRRGSGVIHSIIFLTISTYGRLPVVKLDL